MPQETVSSAELRLLGFEYDSEQGVWSKDFGPHFKEPIYVSNDGSECVITHEDADGWYRGERIRSVSDLVRYMVHKSFRAGRLFQAAEIRKAISAEDVEE